MDVATLVFGIYLSLMTLLIGWLLIRRLDQLPTREEMNARFDAHDQRFEAHERRFDRVDAEIAMLRSESAGMRSDLTQIALAVGARPRPQTG